MVVDDGQRLHVGSNLGCFDKLEVVDVNHDKQSIRANHIHRRCAVDENVFILLGIAQAAQAGLHIGIGSVEHDLGLDAAEHTQPRHADAGTDRVEIGVAVSHDEDIAGRCDH